MIKKYAHPAHTSFLFSPLQCLINESKHLWLLTNAIDIMGIELYTYTAIEKLLLLCIWEGAGDIMNWIGLPQVFLYPSLSLYVKFLNS